MHPFENLSREYVPMMLKAGDAAVGKNHSGRCANDIEGERCSRWKISLGVPMM